MTVDLKRSAVKTPAGEASALELTILMPCLNEAETIEVCVRKAMGFLKRSGVSGEVHHVDCGYHVVGMKAIDAPDMTISKD